MRHELPHQSKKYPGTLITLEGIDGSGKSTIAKLLYEKLVKQNIAASLTKEPGGTTLGYKIRALLEDKTQLAVCDKAEYLLFAADRAQHFMQFVIPALQQEAVVISDRMADSSLAYQGYGRGLDKDIITQVNAWAMSNIRPDLIVYLDISYETAMERIHNTRTTITTFEQEKKQFWHAVQNGFNTIFKNRENVLSLSGENRPEAITDRIIQELIKRALISL